MQEDRTSAARAGEHWPALHWDHTGDPTITDDLWGWFREHGDDQPAFYSDADGGFWVLTRYEDQFEALRQNQVFSTNTLMVPAAPYTRKWIPGQIDPPEHRRYRVALQALFEVSKIASLEGDVREICRSLLRGFREDGHCDFVDAFGAPLPSLLFARLVGLSPDSIEQFRWLSVEMLSLDPERQVVADEELAKCLVELIEDRKRRPGGTDWLGAILEGDADGKEFSDEELINMVQFLFLAGLITTASMLAICFYRLATQPDIRHDLVSRGEVPHTAVDELLRYCTNIAPCREVTRDTEFAGVSMRAGDIVMLPLAAANHDHREFPSPETIDLDRMPNRHLAFGVSVHRCLGAGLARMEIRAALEEFHKVIPDYRIPDGAEIEWIGGINHRLRELPLCWDVV